MKTVKKFYWKMLKFEDIENCLQMKTVNRFDWKSLKFEDID